MKTKTRVSWSNSSPSAHYKTHLAVSSYDSGWIHVASSGFGTVSNFRFLVCFCVVEHLRFPACCCESLELCSLQMNIHTNTHTKYDIEKHTRDMNTDVLYTFAYSHRNFTCKLHKKSRQNYFNILSKSWSCYWTQQILQIILWISLFQNQQWQKT